MAAIRSRKINMLIAKLGAEYLGSLQPDREEIANFLRLTGYSLEVMPILEMIDPPFLILRPVELSMLINNYFLSGMNLAEHDGFLKMQIRKSVKTIEDFVAVFQNSVMHPFHVYNEEEISHFCKDAESAFRVLKIMPYLEKFRLMQYPFFRELTLPFGELIALMKADKLTFDLFGFAALKKAMTSEAKVDVSLILDLLDFSVSYAGQNMDDKITFLKNVIDLIDINKIDFQKFDFDVFKKTSRKAFSGFDSDEAYLLHDEFSAKLLDFNKIITSKEQLTIGLKYSYASKVLEQIDATKIAILMRFSSRDEVIGLDLRADVQRQVNENYAILINEIDVIRGRCSDLLKEEIPLNEKSAIMKISQSLFANVDRLLESYAPPLEIVKFIASWFESALREEKQSWQKGFFFKKSDQQFLAAVNGDRGKHHYQRLLANGLELIASKHPGIVKDATLIPVNRGRPGDKSGSNRMR